jgi:hypothetical protein
VLVDARVVSLAALPAFQVNVLPFAIVATRTCPKLLNDHRPGSSDTSDAEVASPQSTKSAALVTVAPLECAALVEPFAALVIPVKSFEEIPV